MRYTNLALLLPAALLLSACTTVTPAYKDTGTRMGQCVEGGPDAVAQKFYDYQIQHHSTDFTALRPYLSDGLAKLLSDSSQDPDKRALLQSNPFSSSATTPGSADVASASTIPNTDARNIPLRVELKQGTQSWKDEVLMIREGSCWAVDDVRYLGNNTHAPAGTLRQSLEKR
ncbi:lipoprotein [Kluyvera ascorbata]|uniref:lipoprotein n=1 Tax=Kluyvera ascorbata TaxID=51288 RepID=UPI0018A386E7|nr:lipoprotein [Kluyvera ascorbata]BBV66844.1 lipoprotein [Klebsiella sp. STW0522-44]MDU3912685.1 lipoprotein [Kluyvera ascorbata]UPQ70256.1 lipoprotein [Kluyvera ascorbata]HAT7512440.1 lipoprotein [Kluyvera ascorbata]HCL5621543.1 lipoprotein [Kluyvera ascorbata]